MSPAISMAAFDWNSLENLIRGLKDNTAAFRLNGRRKSATVNVIRSKNRVTAMFFRGIAQQVLLGRPFNFNIKPAWYDN